MSLVESLREKSNKVEQAKEKVVEEIKAYFDKYFDNINDLEKDIERLSEHYIKEREVPIITNFWEYHSGCSSTHFSSGLCYWYPNNDKYSSEWHYKGVYLQEIQNEVCEYLKARIKEQMIKLGFSFKREKYSHSKLGYYENTMYFGW